MVGLIIGVVILIILIVAVIKLRPNKNSALHRNLKKKTVDRIRFIAILGIVGAGLYVYSTCFPQGLGSIKDGKFTINAPKITFSKKTDSIVISIRKDEILIDGLRYTLGDEFDAVVKKTVDKSQSITLIDDYALNDTYLSVSERLTELGVLKENISEIAE